MKRGEEKRPMAALIMAGGRGERFWPKSRENFPKQFLSLIGEKSMLQQTVARINKVVPYEQIFIATGKRYQEIVSKQLPQLPEKNIIFEPVGMDTAPCIGLGMTIIQKYLNNCKVVILPSDHVIGPDDKFIETIKKADDFLDNYNGILTIGIKPDRPETGYGYIEVKNKVDNKEIYFVNKFVEKPSKNLAEKYISEKNYFWNSGIFITESDYMLKRIDEYLPELGTVLKKINSSIGTVMEAVVLEEEYKKSPRISIDYGVMQKEKNVYMIKSNFEWDDVGNWNSIGNYLEVDESNKVVGDVLLLDSKDNIVFNEEKVLVTGLGIENLVVVNTKDAILIAKKDDVQGIKRLVEQLKKDHSDLL